MAAAQSPSLLHEYSTTFTLLQAGKRELIHYGVDAVQVNRYIVDSAVSTAQGDPESILGAVNIDRVNQDGSPAERLDYCRSLLSRLVEMQSEINTLKKVAKESGINAGLLTIVGQACVQSPDDHGASVIKQLNLLMNDEVAGPAAKESESDDSARASDNESADANSSTDADKTANAGEAVDETAGVALGIEDGADSAALDNAANDDASNDFERLSSLQKATAILREHWRALFVDVAFCAVASCIAISLVS